jgi:hypothetical protein
MFWMAMETVKGVLVLSVAKLVGKTNLQEGMLSMEVMEPMGAGLQEPVVICFPLVMGVAGRVRAQKLMKLFPEVMEATWPASARDCPLFKNPVLMTELSRVKEFWMLLLSAVAVPVAVSVALEPPVATKLLPEEDAVELAAVEVDPVLDEADVEVDEDALELLDPLWCFPLPFLAAAEELEEAAEPDEEEPVSARLFPEDPEDDDEEDDLEVEVFSAADTVTVLVTTVLAGQSAALKGAALADKAVTAKVTKRRVFEENMLKGWLK